MHAPRLAHPLPSPSRRARVPGVLVGAEGCPGGGLVRFAHARLLVRVTTGGAVFVGWDGAEPTAVGGVLPPTDARARLEPDADGGVRVVGQRVRVCVSASGAVETRTPGGLLLRRDLPPSWWDAPGAADTRWLLCTRHPADARLFGPTGPGGPRLRSGTYGGDAAAVQFAVSDAGCHLVCHAEGEGSLTVREGVEGGGSGHDTPGRAELRRRGVPLRYWVVPGKPPRALRLWTAVSGRPALPRPWELGLTHADPGLRDEAAVREREAAFHRHGLAVSALDVGWVPRDGDGAAAELAAELARRGVHLRFGSTAGRSGWRRHPRRDGDVGGGPGSPEPRGLLGQVLGRGVCGLPPGDAVVGGHGGAAAGEEYARAFQLAACLPGLRTLTAGPRRRGEPWAYGPGVLEAARAALRTRQRLLPYAITLALLAHRTGVPVVRPLWWADPADRALRECEDAFLLGDALLVAPVLEGGVRERSVPLPAGRWYDTATGRVHHGPGVVLLPAPLERIPVLARAGAVVPVAGADGGRELRVWPPEAGGGGGGLLATSDVPGEQADLVRLQVLRRGGGLEVRREDGRRLEWDVRLCEEGVRGL